MALATQEQCVIRTNEGQSGLLANFKNNPLLILNMLKMCQ